MLAVLIRSPSRYDPEVNPRTRRTAGARCSTRMVEEGWLDQAERAAAAYPPVQPKSGTDLGIPGGPEGLS